MRFLRSVLVVRFPRAQGQSAALQSRGAIPTIAQPMKRLPFRRNAALLATADHRGRGPGRAGAARAKRKSIRPKSRNGRAEDLEFFLHGSMSTEVVPERVLRAFIKIYPDLFPASDLAYLGLIPDPAFGWPIGFSRKSRGQTSRRLVRGRDQLRVVSCRADQFQRGARNRSEFWARRAISTSKRFSARSWSRPSRLPSRQHEVVSECLFCRAGQARRERGNGPGPGVGGTASQHHRDAWRPIHSERRMSRRANLHADRRHGELQLGQRRRGNFRSSRIQC